MVCQGTKISELVFTGKTVVGRRLTGSRKQWLHGGVPLVISVRPEPEQLNCVTNFWGGGTDIRKCGSDADLTIV